MWERREDFLVLNPAGTTPVLVRKVVPPVPGAAIIAEYLDETSGAELGGLRLLPRESRRAHRGAPADAAGSTTSSSPR